MADLRAVPGGAEDTSDCDRWCSLCYELVVYVAVSERWEHEKTHNVKCHPYNRLDKAVAMPAPEGMIGKRRARWGQDARSAHQPRAQQPRAQNWIS